MNKQNNRNTTKIVAAVIALIVIAGAMFMLNKSMKPQTSKGSKTIVVEVVHKDGSSKEFTCSTNREYLGEVLQDEKLVEGSNGDYGMFITAADGESVEENSKDWWCITKDKEMLNTSADQTPIADGDHFELTYTKG